MKTMLLILFFIQFLSFSQDNYSKLNIKNEHYIKVNGPIVDSILVNCDLHGEIIKKYPQIIGERIMFRLVKISYQDQSYFRLFDCIIGGLSSRMLKEELWLSRWLANKLFVIYFIDNIDEFFIDQEITEYDFFILT
jgi:hypothetical protein